MSEAMVSAAGVPLGTLSGYGSATSDDLVTGEAVALDLPPASLAQRCASGLLDVLVVFGTLFLSLMVAVTASPRMSEATSAVVFVVLMVLVLVGVPTTVETLTRGKSVGKAALGLRTVRDDGGPIGFQQAFIRSLVGYVEIWVTFGSAAFFASLASSKGKRLGDQAAGTYVVRERHPLALPLPVQMPPHLARWARTADVTSLPVGLGLAVRQLLVRWPTLTVQAREQTAHWLAVQVSPHVAPGPPPGTPAVDFLAAVLATRRERDLARIGRENALRARVSVAGNARR